MFWSLIISILLLNIISILFFGWTKQGKTPQTKQPETKLKTPWEHTPSHVRTESNGSKRRKASKDHATRIEGQSKFGKQINYLVSLPERVANDALIYPTHTVLNLFCHKKTEVQVRATTLNHTNRGERVRRYLHLRVAFPSQKLDPCEDGLQLWLQNFPPWHHNSSSPTHPVAAPT